MKGDQIDEQNCKLSDTIISYTFIKHLILPWDIWSYQERLKQLQVIFSAQMTITLKADDAYVYH